MPYFLSLPPLHLSINIYKNRQPQPVGETRERADDLGDRICLNICN